MPSLFPPPPPPDRYFTVAQLVERGWNKSLIQRLLGDADDAFRLTDAGRPSLIYWRYRVLHVEASAAFAKAKETARERAAKVAPTLERKRALIMEVSQQIAIDVPQLEMEKLLIGRSYLLSDAEAAVEALVRRMRVFEYEIDLYHWHIGIREARKALRLRILEAISEKYPHLRVACEARALLETGAADGQPFEIQPSGEYSAV
ncbi:hypothetical protein [Cupriavidus sp. CuC1]|uniref:hypothetical protein n=1 Tax=Cupriavidus sp. CuC1 TaxID=3373131 RepID=UPI0037CEBCD0